MDKRLPWRGLILSLMIAAIAWAALAGPLDRQASHAVEAGLKRALVTFAIARGLNGVISAAQGTELSLAPAGVGLTLAPGEVLDPVNDLVERFSHIMLLSSVSLGVQRVLLEFSAWLPFSLVLVGVLLLALGARGLGAPPAIGRLLRHLAIVMIALRFAIPLAAIGSEWLYAQFLADRHAQSEAGLVRSREEVEALNRERQASEPPAQDSHWLDRARDWAQGARERFAAATDMQRYEAAVANSARDTIELIVVFLLHTLVLPLALLAAIWTLTRRLLMLPPQTGA